MVVQFGLEMSPIGFVLKVWLPVLALLRGTWITRVLTLSMD
jgi:hypothetical protein